MKVPISTSRSLEILAIVKSARAIGLSEEHIRQLETLGAKPELVHILKKQQAATNRDISTYKEAGQAAFSDKRNLLRCLHKGDCWSFHNAIAAVLEKGDMTEFTNSGSNAAAYWKAEAFGLLGLPYEESTPIADALRIADDRFTRGLYRSAAVAYGLAHLIWPSQNPWTLYNWRRSLGHAHPDICDRTINIIPVP